MRYTIRPISDRTPFGGRHTASQFKVNYSQVLELLDRELEFLGAKDIVVEVDITESGIRLDGQLRADARAASPAVRLAFDSNVGPLTYATDEFVRGVTYNYIGAYDSDNRRRVETMRQDWQHNLYAIAKSLEALRMVDRYGVTKRGEQYTGFKALPGGTPLPAGPPPMARDVAADLLRSYGHVGDDLESCLRRARHATHPDAGHPREQWDRVELAARVLGLIR